MYLFSCFDSKQGGVNKTETKYFVLTIDYEILRTYSCTTTTSNNNNNNNDDDGNNTIRDIKINDIDKT